MANEFNIKNGFISNSDSRVIGALTATTISATTYYNLPTDIRVTGGTYNAGTATFTNNTGGTFSVTGFSTTSTFTGGTVSGATNFTAGLTANTISATTYLNLPTDVRVTGGTYTAGTAVFTNNTGGTFSVTGFSTGTSSTDTYVTGATYSNNTFTYTNNTGGTFNVLFNTMTGLTINGNLSVSGGTGVNSISGNTSTDMLRVTQAGSGRAFVVEDSNNPDATPFQINNTGDVGVGKSLIVSSYYSATTVNTFLEVNSSLDSRIYGIYQNGPIVSLPSYGIFGNGLNIGISGGFASDGGGIGVYGSTGSAGGDTQSGDYIGGKFEASGWNGGTPYSVQLIDSTEGINKVLISKTTDGKANWSSTLSALTGVYSNTISATTYQNLPTDIRVTGGTYTAGTATFRNNTGGTFSVSGFSTGSTTNIGNGTANYLARWTGSTGLSNSVIQDNGTNIGINTSPDTNNKVTITTFSNNYFGLWVRNASNLTGSKGIYGTSNSAIGSQTGVGGVGQGHPTTGTSIGVDGGATDGLIGIGVRGTVGPSEFGSMTTGIGGYFDGRGDGGYGYPSISYSVQLLDGTEGINKVLVSKTSDGKANWSSTLSGLTAVYTTDLTVTGGTQSLFSGNSSVELVKITQTGSGDAFVVEDAANDTATHFVINNAGNVAIGLTQPLGSDKLTISGNTSIYGTVTATNFVGDGSGLTNVTATAAVPYGLINAIATGNYLI